MPLSQEYSNKRQWPITRKASSQSEIRDWYNEYKTFVNAIDADMDSIIPAGHVLTVAVGATAVATGTNLLAAYVAAKLLSPSATNQINIVVPAVIADLGTSQLVMDTDYINLICNTVAQRTDWAGSPVWSEVKKAGFQITGNPAANGVLHVTADQYTIMGVNTEQSSDGTVPSTTIAPTTPGAGGSFIGCSFEGGSTGDSVNISVAATLSMVNCHSEYGIRTSAATGGLFQWCSTSAGKSLSLSGSPSRELFVKNCFLGYTSATSDAMVDATYEDSVISASGSIVFNHQGAASVKFNRCKITATSFGPVGATAYFLGQLNDCDISTAGVLKSVGILNSSVISSSAAAGVIDVDDGATVKNCVVTASVASNAIISTATMSADAFLVSNIITTASGTPGDGIDTVTVTFYAGANVDNSSWIATDMGGGKFADNVFRVQDNTDPTRELAFEVSTITTATTRTVAVQDAAMTIPSTYDLSNLLNVFDITEEPSGFKLPVDPADLILTYDSTARTITVTGTAPTDVEAYYKGELITAMVDGWVSAAHAAAPTQTLFLKYNGSGFTWSTTPWSFNEVQIAYVCYDSGGTFCFAQREPHGFMPWETHLELHDNFGTYRRSGGDFAGVVASSTTAADRRPTVSLCSVRDEDLGSSLAAHTTKNDYTQLVLTGATGLPSLTKSAADIVALSGNNPYWNEFTGGAWQNTLMSNNEYMSLWLIAIPTTDDTASKQARFSWMAGQSSGTLAGQRSLLVTDLDFGLFSSLSPEFVVIEKVIIRYTAANWYYVESERLEGTRAIAVSSPSGSYLSSVSVDGTTILGDGTSTTPLYSGLWDYGSGGLGDNSLIAFGASNTAVGLNNVVGGTGNATTGDKNAIFGESHVVPNDYNVVGGYDHTLGASAAHNAVFGQTNAVDGVKNLAAGVNHVIVGNYNGVTGQGHIVPNSYNIVGGISHTLGASAAHNAVFGSTNGVDGALNIVSGTVHTVAGTHNAVFGNAHTVPNNYNIVGGLTNNLTSADYSAVFGQTHTVSNDHNLVSGLTNGVSGILNSVSGTIQTVAGAYNLVSGESHIVPNNHNVVGGYDHTLGASAAHNAVFGSTNGVDGALNIVSGTVHTVAGTHNAVFGNAHTVPNNYNIVGGLTNNLTSADYSAVFGQTHTVSADHNLVSGLTNGVSGILNSVSGTLQTVVGSHNQVSGESHIVPNNHNVVGGYDHTLGASAAHNAVFGQTNAVDGTKDLVSGVNNTVAGSYNSVTGQGHTVPNSYNAVGGISHTLGASAAFNSVFGNTNAADGEYNGVTGRTQDVAGSYNGVDGQGHTVPNSHNIVGGLTNNLTSADYSAVFGQTHTVSNDHNLVSGLTNGVSGILNSVSGTLQTVVGSHNQVSGESHIVPNNHNVVGGYDHTLGASAAHNAVFGQTNGVDGTKDLVSGVNHTVAGSYNSVTGQGHTVPNSYNAVGGISHTLGASAAFNAVFGNTNAADGEYNGVTGRTQDVAGSYNGVDGQGHTVPNSHNIVGGFTHTLGASATHNAVFGSTNGVSGSYNTVGGFDVILVAGSDYNAIFGNNQDIDGDYNLVGGNVNDVTGNLNLVGGSQAGTIGSSNVIGGYNNDTTGGDNAVFGQHNSTTGSQNLVGGQYNTVTANRTATFGHTNTASGHETLTAGKDNVNAYDLAVVTGKDAEAPCWGAQVFSNGSPDGAETSGQLQHFEFQMSTETAATSSAVMQLNPLSSSDVFSLISGQVWIGRIIVSVRNRSTTAFTALKWEADVYFNRAVSGTSINGTFSAVGAGVGNATVLANLATVPALSVTSHGMVITVVASGGTHDLVWSAHGKGDFFKGSTES